MGDGNNVHYDIDRLTSKCGNASGKTQKGKSKEAEMTREHSHTWAMSSTGAWWNTTEKMDKTVKIENYIRWLSLVMS